MFVKATPPVYIYAIEYGPVTSGIDITTNNVYNAYTFNQNTSSPSLSGTSYNNSLIGKLKNNLGDNSFTATIDVSGGTTINAALITDGAAINSNDSLSEIIEDIQTSFADIFTDIGQYSIIIVYPDDSDIIDRPTDFALSYNGTDHVASIYNPQSSLANSVQQVRNSTTQSFSTTTNYVTPWGSSESSYTNWDYIHVINAQGIKEDNAKVFVSKTSP